MKIYKVHYFNESFQSFMIDRTGLSEEEYKYLTVFDGVSKEEWHPPKVFSTNPKNPAADFWGFCGYGGAMALQPVDPSEVYTHLEIAGQLLPLLHMGRRFELINIVECLDCIDEDQSEWLYSPDGERQLLVKPDFIESHIGGSSLFKIPELPLNIYCWEEYSQPLDSFKAAVEANELTGLKFELVWDGENC